jgi:hypothetical protein
VLDSDGTLIVSHGELAGEPALTRKSAAYEGRPCLHVDLDMLALKQAAKLIKSWIIMNEIEILNVTGPRASHDPEIYQATMQILLTALHLMRMAEVIH